MKKIIKLGLTLGVYACISCCLLAVVNNFTSPVIEKNETEKEQNALKEVLKDAKDYIAADKTEVEKITESCKNEIGSAKINKIFKAVDADNKIIGYAANITGPTFENSTILLGLNADMVVTGVNILKTTDTPGKQKMADYKTSKVTTGKTFTEQFIDKAPLSSFEAGIDYETISGATLSSGGVSNMIKAGTIVIKAYAASNK